MTFDKWWKSYHTEGVCSELEAGLIWDAALDSAMELMRAWSGSDGDLCYGDVDNFEEIRS